MACRDGDASPLEEQHFKGQKARQIAVKMRGAFSKKNRAKMTRRAFLSSKSNTGAGEIDFKKACQKSWQIVPKNKDFSESASSIDCGAIFPPRSGHDLSRNVPVVSVYAL